MAKRKSLNDALSPEEEAFLENGKASPSTRRQALPSGEAHGIQKGASSAPNAVPDPQMIILPHVPDFADAGLTTLNVRIEPSIVGAVLRASMVRKIQKQKPYAQREIVAEALRDWLRNHGYLK